MTQHICDAGHVNCFYIHSAIAASERLYAQLVELLAPALPGARVVAVDADRAGHYLEIIFPDRICIAGDANENWGVSTLLPCNAGDVEEYESDTGDAYRYDDSDDTGPVSSDPATIAQYIMSVIDPA
jgi:hypothetical protein